MTFNFRSNIGISVSMSRVATNIDCSVGGYQGEHIESNSKWTKVNIIAIRDNIA